MSINTREAIANRIMELSAERNISLHKLAREAGLPPSTLKNIIYGVSKNPGVITLKIICDSLDMTLAQFFDTPAFNSLEQEIR